MGSSDFVQSLSPSSEVIFCWPPFLFFMFVKIGICMCDYGFVGYSFFPMSSLFTRVYVLKYMSMPSKGQFVLAKT